MIVLSNIETLYDGKSADPASLHRGCDLLIDKGRIHALEPHRPDRPLHEDDVSIDASAYTVTPGLIDCHGHVTLLGLDSKSIELMNTGAAIVHVEKVLYTTLVDGGVTTMRDVGGATHLMKRLVEEGTCLGPRLKISICMLSSTGGHADFRGPDRCHGELSKIWPPGPGRPSSIVDSPWEARKRVREIAACGGDLIKLCASPGVASPGDKLEHRDLHPEEVEAITEEASARGMKVAAHAHSQSGIELAIQYGVHDLQHISFMDERLVDLAFENQCTVTPTSWVTEELLSAEGLSDFVMEKVKQVNEHHKQAVQYAATGELPILMGTDPVLPGMHGRNYMELHHLISDGLKPLATWWGATGLAAREIGVDDTGTLEAGQRADLLIARGDVIEKPGLFDEGALVEVVQDGHGHRGLEGFPQRDFRTTVETSRLRPS